MPSLMIGSFILTVLRRQLSMKCSELWQIFLLAVSCRQRSSYVRGYAVWRVEVQGFEEDQALTRETPGRTPCIPSAPTFLSVWRFPCVAQGTFNIPPNPRRQ